ncbi:MAG: hypothetical protein K0S33_2515 [Bacteroidetes bacterium]|jgi:hypothetical protein|nr:hypothetical protein [Bacteroidota bacterium]
MTGTFILRFKLLVLLFSICCSADGQVIVENFNQGEVTLENYKNLAFAKSLRSEPEENRTITSFKSIDDECSTYFHCNLKF